MKVSSVIRKFTVLLALSSLALTMMNCSKKDEDTPQAQIVGTWKFSNFFVKEGNGPETDYFPIALFGAPCLANVTFTFNSNGKATTSIPNDCKDVAEDFVPDVDQATVEVKDNKLIVTSSGGTEEIPVSFEGNKMFWTFSDTDNGVTTTVRMGFTKQ
ncbi:lipocalin family protein [Emticicia sp. BO119]|uniref:lipocalin family protein n=1 Tax=Emticicia sp. BO119 TaxID=2757768 RepID=UPI0015F04F8B|nr:lipocalin family protein [Emticicia sp. BO119]MBA4851992.1 lipocalin family protein [Emticicia sp. BO119]